MSCKVYEYDRYDHIDETTDYFRVNRKNGYFDSLLKLKKFSVEFKRAEELFTKKIKYDSYSNSKSCNICKTDLMNLDIEDDGTILVTYHNYQNESLPITVSIFRHCDSFIKNKHYLDIKITAHRSYKQTYIRNMDHLNNLVLDFLKDMTDQVISKATPMLKKSDEDGTIRTVYEKQAVNEVNTMLGLI